MYALRRVKANTEVIIATKTNIVDGKPECKICIGFWNGTDIRVQADNGATENLPVTMFQRWWPLPYAQFVTVSL